MNPHTDIDTLIALVQEAGAHHLVEDVRILPQPLLCRRLAQHLRALEQALERTAEQSHEAIDRMATLRALAEIAIDQNALRADADRTSLDHWLTIERTRFLMATKVDALVALDAALLARNGRRELRRAAGAEVRRIVDARLTWFRDRLHAETTRRLSSLVTGLVAEMERSVGQTAVPLDGMTSAQVTLRAFRRPIVALRSLGIAASIATRVGLSSRRSIADSARDELVDGLERGSRQLVHLILDDYDELRAAAQTLLFGIIDTSLESEKCAASFGANARAGGAEGVARARVRIEDWFEALWAIEGPSATSRRR